MHDLDKKALAGEDMPTGLNQAEQLYYISVRSLYNSFSNGEITKHQATKEKAILLEQFQKNQEVMKYYEKVSIIYGEFNKLKSKARPVIEEYRKIHELIEQEL